MNGKKVVVIGSGFASLAAATSLAASGFTVEVLEKNNSPGGRARSFSENGFTFDMGPSWYWMPDVFEHYFKKFGKSTADYYQLTRLDPSYTIIFGQDDFMPVPAQMGQLNSLFESLETGSSQALHKFLAQAAYKYEVGINNLVYKPSRSVTEFLNLKLLVDVLRLDVFQSIHVHLRKYFRHEKLLKLLEFPILFLGALPENTPALYSLMNYADISLGTWYPKGGMYQIVAGMVELAKEQGVIFHFNQEVKQIQVQDNEAKQVITATSSFMADVVVAGADYHHVEQNILAPEYRTYSQAYWDKRVMAPSSLIFYLGVNKRLNRLTHHNLFFDEDFTPHAREIYETPQWPAKPLFYVSAPSQTDTSVAPEGCENLFILIPVAPDLEDTEAIREHYYHLVMDRLEKLTKQTIRDAVVVKRSYAHADFIRDYHAFKGNAYGLANTLMQTALLKPGLKSKKVKNLYFTGQLTVPGPGMPPSLISGQVVAEEIRKEYSVK
ncbi:phytoene desaturase family protein [Adhaeribacter pallidiroseus]|uniref:All-trans-zeta-carotene desaturase n=1 Tax=Adhaeribacter pallidiroseus TaxID=2072847 RepID=A0A369QG68_9BACT|nr:phytoene desaturase family protein [Adhaeribacter pallidiroseus]RDC62226.1 All-trans-zeta-carotene desaturase [Adhaeribacter pallidiroseus]